jgi:hypothetical protein
MKLITTFLLVLVSALASAQAEGRIKLTIGADPDKPNPVVIFYTEGFIDWLPKGFEEFADSLPEPYVHKFKVDTNTFKQLESALTMVKGENYLYNLPLSVEVVRRSGLVGFSFPVAKDVRKVMSGLLGIFPGDAYSDERAALSQLSRRLGFDFD